MTSNGRNNALVPMPRSERPRLLPFNRRLRHLQGIIFRNLNLSPETQRNRGKTIDDEALPYALKSPSKLEVSKEDDTLVHSRSSGDLQARSPHSSPLSKKNELALIKGHGKKPAILKPRRRSTLDWNATPLQRQERLEDSLRKHKAELFFSIHVDGIEEPVYISEISERSMNPDFRFFDLSSCEPSISRSATCTIKFWAKPIPTGEWQYHLELAVYLRSLQFLGKSLENYLHALPDNTVLFHLSDGIYASLPNASTSTTERPIILPRANTLPHDIQPTSSYDALMRLATLDECIQDVVSSQRKLAQSIKDMLNENQQQFYEPAKLEIVKDSYASTKRAITGERRQINALSNRLAEHRASLAARKESMTTGRAVHQHLEENGTDDNTKLEHSRTAHQQLAEDTSGQRRRICEDLQRIYPIDPLPGRALEFTIRNLPLPNSDFSNVNVKEDVVSAAVGYVAHVVNLLSFYLAVPLPYPMKLMSSQSSIRDPISLMAGSRNFPLYLGRGSAMFRFEYGVFLLNKNIETLSAKLGLKVIDIRQTLPNLKYVLFVATAGKGQLPARKAGGVRGLLKGGPAHLNGESSQESSRRGSDDSAEMERLKHKIGRLKQAPNEIGSNDKAR